MSGAAPNAPAADDKKGEASRGKGGEAGTPHESFLLTKVPEALVKGPWAAIKGIGKYTWQLVRGAVGATWNATGGAVVSGVVAGGKHIANQARGLAQIGNEIMEGAKKRHHIGKLGPAIRGIALGTALAVGTVFSTPVHAGGGAVMSATQGLQNVGDAVMMKYDERKGGDGGHDDHTGGSGNGNNGHGEH